MICTLWALASTLPKLCDISDFTTGLKVETVEFPAFEGTICEKELLKRKSTRNSQPTLMHSWDYF